MIHFLQDGPPLFKIKHVDHRTSQFSIPVTSGYVPGVMGGVQTIETSYENAKQYNVLVRGKPYKMSHIAHPI